MIFALETSGGFTNFVGRAELCARQVERLQDLYMLSNPFYPFYFSIKRKVIVAQIKKMFADMLKDESLLRLINQKSDGRRRGSSAVLVELEKMAANLTYFAKKK